MRTQLPSRSRLHRAPQRRHPPAREQGHTARQPYAHDANNMHTPRRMEGGPIRRQTSTRTTQHHRPISHGDQSTRKGTGLDGRPRVGLDGGGGVGVLLAAGASGKGAGPVGSSHCDSPVCSLT